MNVLVNIAPLNILVAYIRLPLMWKRKTSNYFGFNDPHHHHSLCFQASIMSAVTLRILQNSLAFINRFNLAFIAYFSFKRYILLFADVVESSNDKNTEMKADKNKKIKIESVFFICALQNLPPFPLEHSFFDENAAHCYT